MNKMNMERINEVVKSQGGHVAIGKRALRFVGPVNIAFGFMFVFHQYYTWKLTRNDRVYANDSIIQNYSNTKSIFEKRKPVKD